MPADQRRKQRLRRGLWMVGGGSILVILVVLFLVVM